MSGDGSVARNSAVRGWAVCSTIGAPPGSPNECRDATDLSVLASSFWVPDMRDQPRAYQRLGPPPPVMSAAEGLRATICCLVYSRVVLPVLVLQTRVSIQSGRSCFSICREPQLDAGHPLASQQRWCDESYLLAICVAYRNHQGHGPKHGLCQALGHSTC